MQRHTKVYMEFFGYDYPEEVFSEISGEPVQDIHHIDGRGIGKDRIENLIGLTRREHEDAHAGKYTKQELREIHLRFMEMKQRKKVRFF